MAKERGKDLAHFGRTESSGAHLASKPRPLVAVTAEPRVNGQHPPQQQPVESPRASQPEEPPWFDDEPIVKSPPEPTRVKSPEQMIMRSPEPVNWTVPLDTGKTFTVTQNVLEGEYKDRLVRLLRPRWIQCEF